MEDILFIIKTKEELDNILIFDLKYIYTSDDCFLFHDFKPYLLIKTIYIYHVIGETDKTDILVDKVSWCTYYTGNKLYNLKYNTIIPLFLPSVKYMLMESFDKINNLQIKIKIEFKPKEEIYIGKTDDYLNQIPSKWIDLDVNLFNLIKN